MDSVEGDARAAQLGCDFRPRTPGAARTHTTLRTEVHRQRPRLLTLAQHLSQCACGFDERLEGARPRGRSG
jgi:hypothetical protein